MGSNEGSPKVCSGSGSAAVIIRLDVCKQLGTSGARKCGAGNLKQSLNKYTTSLLPHFQLPQNFSSRVSHFGVCSALAQLATKLPRQHYAPPRLVTRSPSNSAPPSPSSVLSRVVLPTLRCFPPCPAVCLRTPMARSAVLPPQGCCRRRGRLSLPLPPRFPKYLPQSGGLSSVALRSFVARLPVPSWLACGVSLRCAVVWSSPGSSPPW